MIVGLAGRKRSGKDSAAAVLVEKHGFTRVALADAVREFIALMLDQPLRYINNDFFKADTQVISYAKVCGGGNFGPGIGETFQFELGKLSGRELLQRVGTEAARKIFGADCWIKVALAKCVTAGHECICGRKDVTGIHGPEKGHAFQPKVEQHYVITDVRFPNEFAAIKAAGGKVIRLNRADREYVHDFLPGDKSAICDEEIQLADRYTVCGLSREAHPSHYSGDIHPSETSLPDDSNETFQYDAVITGGLEENVWSIEREVAAWLGKNI